MKISKNIIEHAGSIYPVKNISMVDVVYREFEGEDIEKHQSSVSSTFGLCVLISTIGGGILAKWGEMSFWAGAGIGFALNLLFCNVMVRAEWWPFGKKPPMSKEYAIRILSNSGSSNLFWCEDKEFVHLVRGKIAEAIEGCDDGSYVVNLDNRTVIDISDRSQHTTNHNYFDYSIKVDHYEGVSEEQMAFFTQTLSQSLEDLGAKIEETGSNEMKEDMREMVRELNTAQPDPNVVSTLWSRVKKLGETCGLANDLAAATGSVMAGLALLGAS